MPIDAPVINRLVQELSSLLPVKIDKIHQPYADEFLFSCFGMGESFKILISLNSQYARIHSFYGTKDNPYAPSSFCMLLRKHFGGAKLIRAEAIPFERICKLTFEVYDPINGLSKKLIWLELTGKSANLIVTAENGQIIDAWRRSNSKKTNDREINAGLKYELPPTGGRWQPVTIKPEEFAALLAQIPDGISLEKFLLKHWYGLSTLSVGEIIHSAGFEPSAFCSQMQESDARKLYEAFSAWSSDLTQNKVEPVCLYTTTATAIDCAAFKLLFPPAGLTAKSVNNLNQAVAEIFNTRQELGRFNESKQNLLRKVKFQLDKTVSKIEKQKQEAKVADQGDQFRIAGELLTTYGSQIGKGSTEARLSNHYDPQGKEMVISLNPALPAQMNAQNYFKKYQKAKKGQLAIAAQIAKTQEVIDYLDSIEAMIQSALNPADLKLIQEELDQSGQKKALATKKSHKPIKKEVPAEPRRFSTPAGHTILVGRNNFQNDRLTFKIADPTDIWFHTQKIPGSHVILRPKPGVALDDESLNYACQLAAYFSKAQQSSKVPVDYTPRKNVKKPPASKPGFVIYDFFKTAIITPDFTLLEALGVPKPN